LVENLEVLQGMFAGFFAGGVSGQKSKSRGLYVPLGGVFVANKKADCFRWQEKELSPRR